MIYELPWLQAFSTGLSDVGLRVCSISIGLKKESKEKLLLAVVISIKICTIIYSYTDLFQISATKNVCG